MKQKSGLISTVVLGVFLCIALFFAYMLLSLNLKEGLTTYAASLGETNTEGMGEMMLVIVALGGLGALALILISYAFAVIPTLISGICLIFSINNRKRDSAAIRGINLFYDIAFSLILLFGIIKIFLFSTGIG